MNTWRKVWICERKGKRRRAYSLRWYGEDGRVKTKAASSDKRIAEQMRCARELRINSEDYSERPAMRLSEFAAEHLRLQERRITTGSMLLLKGSLNSFLTFCGDKLLERVTLADCERYLSERLGQVRPATASRDLTTLLAAFQVGVKRGDLAKNPFSGVKPVREPEKTLRVLTTSEVGRLLDACHDPVGGRSCSWR